MNFLFLLSLICFCGLNVRAQDCKEGTNSDGNWVKGKGDCSWAGLGFDCVGGCGNLNQIKLNTLIILTLCLNVVFNFFSKL